MHMLQMFLMLALGGNLVIAKAAAPVAVAHVHGHDHADAATAVELPAPGKLWAVDAPLQSGMKRIRGAVTTLAHREHGHLDRAQVLAQAAIVDSEIRAMIANCKLEPKADAALHGIIGRLLAAAQQLKNKPEAVTPIAVMRAALEDYPRLFDDPSWAKAVE